MAIAVANQAPAEATLTTTLTKLTRSSPVNVAYVVGTGDMYLVYDDTLDDAAAVPAARMRIPANTAYPVNLRSKRVLLAAVSGTVTVNVDGATG